MTSRGTRTTHGMKEAGIFLVSPAVSDLKHAGKDAERSESKGVEKGKGGWCLFSFCADWGSCLLASCW